MILRGCFEMRIDSMGQGETDGKEMYPERMIFV
jgi:hypothetical protein